jgi:inhibitor of KinA sporulation pathway (predicted exonuclease)
MTRRALYKAISEAMGREFHTAKIRTVEEAREVYRVVKRMIETSV